MFSQLIEDIRDVVEAKRKVDQIDKYARQGSSGNKYLKNRASKARRQGGKEAIRKGEYDKAPSRVTGGYAS